MHEVFEEEKDGSTHENDGIRNCAIKKLAQEKRLVAVVTISVYNSPSGSAF